MRVSVKLSKKYTPPYAVIYADAVTDEIQNAVDYLGASEKPLLAQHEDQIDLYLR